MSRDSVTSSINPRRVYALYLNYDAIYSHQHGTLIALHEFYYTCMSVGLIC